MGSIKKKKNLDDFFAKKNGRIKANRDGCDLSLCSATTKKEPQPAALCTWKQNPDAFKPLPQMMAQRKIGGLYSLSKTTPLRQEMLIMSVREGKTSRVRQTTTSSLGGITFGMAQLLYTQGENVHREGTNEGRTDTESLYMRELNESLNVRDEDQSIEVSMSDINFDADDKSSASSLGRKGTLMMKRAKLAEQKARIEENKIAAQRRFLDLEHSEFQSILRDFRKDAILAEEKRKEKEARLAERRRMLREAYLKEQARLQDEEERLIEESRKAAEATRRILEEAQLADLDSSSDEQISRSLSNLNILCALSETTCENDDEPVPCENESLGKHHWRELDAAEFKVRGKNYLVDRKKVPSQPNLFRLITVDMVQVSEPIMTGFCSHPRERVQKWLQQEKYDQENSMMPEFVFCVNLILPGPPYYHLVMYFGIDNLSDLGLESGSRQSPYSSSLKRFLFGNSNEFRNKSLKLIPNVKEGSFLLKTAVGTRPFILGKYLKQRFIKGARYLEVISDVGSSSTFEKLLKLSSHYNSNITGAMAFVLEASDEVSLPENVLCSVEFTNQDFDGNIRFVEDMDEASC